MENLVTNHLPAVNGYPPNPRGSIFSASAERLVIDCCTAGEILREIAAFDTSDIYPEAPVRPNHHTVHETWDNSMLPQSIFLFNFDRGPKVRMIVEP